MRFSQVGQIRNAKDGRAINEPPYLALHRRAISVSNPQGRILTKPKGRPPVITIIPMQALAQDHVLIADPPTVYSCFDTSLVQKSG